MLTMDPKKLTMSVFFTLMLTCCTVKACTDEQFTCGNGNCIPGHYMCDQFDDCQDGSDEDHCSSVWPPPQECSFEEFSCANGNCIPTAWTCDNFDDCRDNSDEDHCIQLALIITLSLVGAVVTIVLPICVSCVICCLISSCPLYFLCRKHRAAGAPAQPVMTTVVAPQSYPMQQMPPPTYPPPGYGYPPPQPYFTANSEGQEGHGPTVYPAAAPLATNNV